MLWWDTRKLEEPIDSLVLSTNSRGGDGVTLGGSSLEYNIEAGEYQRWTETRICPQPDKWLN